MILNAGQQKTTDLKGVKVCGLKIAVYSVGNAVNVEPSTPSLALPTITATLLRQGKQVDLANMPLLWWGMHSNITRPNFAMLHPLVDASINLRTATAGLSGVKLKVFDLYFGGTLDLQSSDSIKISANVPLTTFAGNSSTSLSYIEILPIYSTDFEAFVPKVRSYVIQSGESSNNYPLGDNVKAISYLNLDAENSTQVINNLTITSRQWSEQFNWFQLANLTTSKFPQSLYGSNSFTDVLFNCTPILIDSQNVDVDQCKLDINFASANVTASNNFIICTQFDTSIEQLQNYEQSKQMALEEKLSNLPSQF